MRHELTDSLALHELAISDSGRGILPRLDSPGLGFGLPLMGRLCDDLQSSSDDGAAVRA